MQGCGLRGHEGEDRRLGLRRRVTLLFQEQPGASKKYGHEVGRKSCLSYLINLSNEITSLRLAEVGKLEPIKLQGNYDTGQMFLHRCFFNVIIYPLA